MKYLGIFLIYCAWTSIPPSEGMAILGCILVVLD